LRRKNARRLNGDASFQINARELLAGRVRQDTDSMTHEFDPEEVAKFENAAWSRSADTYVDGFGALLTEAIAPLLDEVRVGDGDRVLDVGCGPGLVAGAAAERGAEAVGIDFSEAMVATARRQYPALAFHRASADSLLLFDDGEFDAVVGNFVLHHVAQPDQVLREASRVLRSGGRVGFTVWAEPTKLEAFGLFFAAVQEHAGAAELPHGPLFGVSDPAVFHTMLRTAGFSDSSVRELPIEWRTSSIEPYIASFRAWADLETVPRSVRDAIETTVRDRAASYRSGDAFVLPNPAILISAVK
jgi:ubiquinone/menaquinone biosynthesis C-methylase UbiE